MAAPGPAPSGRWGGEPSPPTTAGSSCRQQSGSRLGQLHRGGGKTDLDTTQRPLALVRTASGSTEESAARLSGLLGDDEPEEEVHQLPHAEEPEECETDADQSRVQAEELCQATAYAGEEAV